MSWVIISCLGDNKIIELFVEWDNSFSLGGLNLQKTLIYSDLSSSWLSVIFRYILL